MTELYLFAFANWAICTLVGFIAVCRINAMQGPVLYRVRSEYAAYIGGATVSGFQFWLGEWPGWGSLGMSTAMLVGLLCSAHAWRVNDRDQAPAIASGHGDFRNADGTPLELEAGAPADNPEGA